MTTQAQIDALKQTVSVLTSQVSALTADVPPVGELYSSYNSAFLGTRTYYPVGVDGSGVPGNPPVAANPFLSQAVDATHGVVIWGTSTEHHALLADARGGGEVWGALQHYGSSADPTIAYPEEVVKCDWTNLGTGVVRDMAGFTVGPVGGIMCPQVLPASGTWRIRQWGYAWSAPPPVGSRQQAFYWQADYTFGQVIRNAAWVGDANNNRLAIRYSEAWWDAVNGWAPDTGTAPSLPWINGQPAIVNVTYAGWGAFGKGAGTLWAHQYPDYKVALARTT
jgi:hypothetical protein